MNGHTSHIGDISPDLHPQMAVERLRLLYPKALPDAPASSLGQYDDWIFAGKGSESVVLCPSISFPEPFTTHGHRDLGSFVWFHKGITVLADAGRFQYAPDPVSRAQVTAGAHNSLLINGLGALPESLFTFALWLPEGYSQVRCDADVDSEDCVVLRHNGFSRLGTIGDHVRQVRIQDNRLLVLDCVEGSGMVRLELLWHFAPGFRPSTLGLAEVRGPGFGVSVASMAAESLLPMHDWEVYEYSSEYGQKQASYRLRLAWLLQLPCTIRTTLKVASCAV
jgi:hypothetical protein